MEVIEVQWSACLVCLDDVLILGKYLQKCNTSAKQVPSIRDHTQTPEVSLELNLVCQPLRQVQIDRYFDQMQMSVHFLDLQITTVSSLKLCTSGSVSPSTNKKGCTLRKDC